MPLPSSEFEATFGSNGKRPFGAESVVAVTP